MTPRGKGCRQSWAQLPLEKRTEPQRLAVITVATRRNGWRKARLGAQRSSPTPTSASEDGGPEPRSAARSAALAGGHGRPPPPGPLRTRRSERRLHGTANRGLRPRPSGSRPYLDLRLTPPTAPRSSPLTSGPRAAARHAAPLQPRSARRDPAAGAAASRPGRAARHGPALAPGGAAAARAAAAPPRPRRAEPSASVAAPGAAAVCGPGTRGYGRKASRELPCRRGARHGPRLHKARGAAAVPAGAAPAPPHLGRCVLRPNRGTDISRCAADPPERGAGSGWKYVCEK